MDAKVFRLVRGNPALRQALTLDDKTFTEPEVVDLAKLCGGQVLTDRRVLRVSLEADALLRFADAIRRLERQKLAGITRDWAEQQRIEMLALADLCEGKP